MNDIVARQETEGRSERRLQALLGRLLDDLRFADTKASTLLALAGGLAAGAPVVGNLLPPPAAADHMAGKAISAAIPWLVFVGYALAVSAVGSAVRAIRPRGVVVGGIAGDKFWQWSGWFGPSVFSRDPPLRNVADNPETLDCFLHCAEIAGFGNQKAFLEHFGHRRENSDFERALAHDVFRIAEIAYLKHRWVDRAVVLVGWEAIVFLAFVFLRFLQA